MILLVADLAWHFETMLLVSGLNAIAGLTAATSGEEHLRAWIERLR